ncbi:MAG TPA: MFS transporter [Rhodopila sp.]|uniref:MFS transporter n=1 Tax=Rhodopila sp. TaxID=2480087 RepID=UPI002B8B469A|nr:MFS transporter [Rhodopila sp.]HVY17792.1 MFS transporter [Rhodopila sp.]
MSDIETRTIRKVAMRLLPFIFMLYIVCLIDRVNLSFAALTMNRDLGLNPYVYGLGASIFFIGYFVFEVPSNLLLDRVGARLWITRIMISWGLTSAAMALVRGEASFLIVRFLLGFFEAGFFPGMILYLTFWFPAAYRARVIAAFMLAIPVTGVIGGPLATSLLQLDGTLGLTGWQWMFLAEGIPAALLGFVVLGFMTDRPSSAKWLTQEERQWLETTLARERDEVEGVHSQLSLWQGLVDPRVLALSLVYFGMGTATYGVVYFLPQIIKGWGLSTLQTGFVASVPDILGTIGMLVWGYFSDRQADRRSGVATTLLLCTAGLIGLGAFSASPWSLIAMAMVSIGLNASRPLFWALPSVFLSRTAAAGAIALINALGNLGGIAGPTMLGWVRTSTGSFADGLYFLGFCTFVAAVLVLVALRAPSRVAASLAR